MDLHEPRGRHGQIKDPFDQCHSLDDYPYFVNLSPAQTSPFSGKAYGAPYLRTARSIQK